MDWIQYPNMELMELMDLAECCKIIEPRYMAVKLVDQVEYCTHLIQHSIQEKR